MQSMMGGGGCPASAPSQVQSVLSLGTCENWNMSHTIGDSL